MYRILNRASRSCTTWRGNFAKLGKKFQTNIICIYRIQLSRLTLPSEPLHMATVLFTTGVHYSTTLFPPNCSLFKVAFTIQRCSPTFSDLEIYKNWTISFFFHWYGYLKRFFFFENARNISISVLPWFWRNVIRGKLLVEHRNVFTLRVQYLYTQNIQNKMQL